MSASDFISAIKEFFLDIIGYLVPGCVAIFFINLTIKDAYKFHIDELGVSAESVTLLFLLIAYVLGYALYSLSVMIDPVIKVIKSTKVYKFIRNVSTYLFTESKSNAPTSSTNEKVKENEEIRISKLILEKLICRHTPDFKIDRLKANNVRSLVMSYIPEADTKIYTFKFRAELSRIIESFGLIFSISGIIITLVERASSLFFIFKTDHKSLIIYTVVLLAAILLGKTRRRFESIADKIPFSIFIAKFTNLVSE